MTRSPEEALSELTDRLTATLGDQLLGLVVHGSYVAGDFHPRRSDLDLLAILARDPDESTCAVLARLYADLFGEDLHWAGRVEVDLVSAAAVRAILAGEPAHPMVRVSPGEPMHLIPATSHYLLNWQSAQQHGRVLAGLSARDLLPSITVEHTREVVLDHVRQWPDWVTEARRPGMQAYAVLTLCRAAATLDSGGQVSKRAAAAYGLARLPRWAPLISWAESWWYDDGSDEEPDRSAAVTDFVREVVATLLTEHARR